MRKFLLPLLAVVAVVSLGAAVFTYLRFSTSRPVVTVGGQKISKFEYTQAMETQVGAAVMKKLVYSALVMQAAAAANVMPTDADVEARLALLEKQKPDLAPAMQQNAPLAAQTRTDLKTDLALENLRIKGVTASEPEIQSFYDTNKAAFVIPSQTQTTLVVSQNKTDSATAEHLLGLDTKPEVIARTPRLRVAGIGGFNVDLGRLDPATRTNLGKVVMSLKPGQIKTLAIGNLFLTFKVKSSTPNILQPLSKVHDQVARLVRLKKAITPQQEIASLYAATTPSFNNERYRTYFADVEQFNAQNAGKKKVAATP